MNSQVNKINSMNGVLNIYKPIGMTSFDVVRIVKKLCKTKKVGHTGTLDPDAEGVLPICIGRATKIVDYIMSDIKTYRTTLKLGVITDTYDASGKVLQESLVNVSEQQVIDTIKSFIGNIEQEPPMYSALKINGVRLYELARKGIEVERKLRKIQIHDIQINELKLPFVDFTVKCSKGTYIRSLCFDIGNLLNCGGAMWSLQRIQTGAFHDSNAVKLTVLNEENINDYIIPIDEALFDMHVVKFSRNLEKQLMNGVEVQLDKIPMTLFEGTLYKTYFDDGEFIGIGEKVGKNFKIKTKLIVEQ